MNDDPLPEEITLEAPRLQSAGFAALVTVTSVVGIRSIPTDMTSPADGMRLRWVLGIVVALVVTIYITRLVLCGNKLKLDRYGFEMTMGLPDRHEWLACSEFEVVRKGGFGHSHTLILFHDENYVEKSIFQSYGLAWAELADLLNRFRQRVLAGVEET
ncbi:MAG: hypothetical protein GC155_01795 [Alphaproteobacteria bacterium]|nr:hypothetical protein [Alphaproteobacteria bacterium]